MTDPAQADERDRPGATIYAEIMEDAPWAPVFNEQRFTMRSKRIGGRGRALRRSGAHPGPLRRRVFDRCAVTRHTIHGRHHHFGWDNSIPPVERIAPGTTLEFECNDAADGAALGEKHRRRRGDARLRAGQPGHRPGLHRRGRAGRRAEGHVRRLRAVGLRAGRRTSRASGCSPTSSPSRRCTSGATTLGMRPAALRAGGAGAAQALRRHDRPRAGRAGAALGRAAAAGRRQPRHPRPRRRLGALPAGRGGGRASSRSATPTPPRATARSAAPRSRARWR